MSNKPIHPEVALCANQLLKLVKEINDVNTYYLKQQNPTLNGPMDIETLNALMHDLVNEFLCRPEYAPRMWTNYDA